MKNTKNIQKHHLIVLLITLLLFLWAGFDILHHDGMVGVTKRGPDPYGCICHGSNMPTDSILVYITGPETVYTGSTNTYTITMSGGPAVAGGFNISVGSGSVYPVDSTTQRLQNFLSVYELTHTEPKAFTDGSVSWQFTYTAAGVAGKDTMYSVGNSVNLSYDPTGDMFNDGIDCIVTVVESVQTYQFGVSEKWNLLSLPVNVTDKSRAHVFPNAQSNAYSFSGSGGYLPKDTLQAGTGYWVKFGADTNYSFTGFSYTELNVPVETGWNMIGMISTRIPASSITSEPGGIITSQFYKYNNGYTQADTLEPMKGYWVKVQQAGTLHLSDSPGATASNAIRIVQTSELPPAPPQQSAVGETPVTVQLYQNYPNPFNPATSFTYHIPSAGFVSLTVYSILGEKVAEPVHELQPAGVHTVQWNAENLPSGIYTCRLNYGGMAETKKMILLK